MSRVPAVCFKTWASLWNCTSVFMLQIYEFNVGNNTLHTLMPQLWTGRHKPSLESAWLALITYQGKYLWCPCRINHIDYSIMILAFLSSEAKTIGKTAQYSNSKMPCFTFFKAAKHLFKNLFLLHKQNPWNSLNCQWIHINGFFVLFCV